MYCAAGKQEGKTEMSGRRCPNQHRNIWVLGQGYWVWCYECGAIRGKDDPKWTYTVGTDGINPAMADFYKEHPDQVPAKSRKGN